MKVTVVGLGKLGCAYAALMSSKYGVMGLDINEDTVAKINVGESPINEPGVAELIRREPFGSQRGLYATTDPEEAATWSDTWIMVLPTPSLDDGSYDASAIIQALEAMNPIRSALLVIVKSTVSPGTCAGLADAVGDAQLIYHPEFIALGSILNNLRDPDFQLLGVGDDHFYSRIGGWMDEVVHANEGPRLSVEQRPPTYRMTHTEAEIAKIALNAYITMKVSFANSIGELAEAYGANPRKILEAVGADSRVGQKYLQPGPPYAGPCFPRDNRALQQAGRVVEVGLPLALATDLVNDDQVTRMVERVVARNPKTVTVLGIAYRAGAPTDDESPGRRLAAQLAARGIGVVAWDPQLPALMASNGLVRSPNGMTLAEAVDLTDLIVLATNDPAWERLRGRDNVIDWWG